MRYICTLKNTTIGCARIRYAKNRSDLLKSLPNSETEYDINTADGLVQGLYYSVLSSGYVLFAEPGMTDSQIDQAKIYLADGEDVPVYVFYVTRWFE